MKKRFLINILIVGATCLVIFGILQNGEVEKMKAKNRNLESQKQLLENENKKLRENLQNIRQNDSSKTRFN